MKTSKLLQPDLALCGVFFDRTYLSKRLSLLAALMLSACTTTPGAQSGNLVPTFSAVSPAKPSITCSDGYSIVDSDFAGSGMAGCEVLGPDHYRLLIRQEDPAVINCSAWYAFRIQAAEPREILVDLDYEQCGHRYLPKLSQAGDTPAMEKEWTLIAPERYSVEAADEDTIAQARLALTAGPAPQIVSAQELLLPSDYAAWLDSLASSKLVSRSLLGRSLEGAPIEKITIAEGDAIGREQLVVVGRQHPPEVTGGLALIAFTERLMENDPLARAFRQRVATTVVPLLNPDGVVRGYWRHSRGERDLNRDWGPFTQPETRLMRDFLEAIKGDPAKSLRFFMDFHSTGYDVLYTLDKSLVTDPPEFTNAWVADYQSRLPGYEVVEQPGHNSESPVSKAWVFERFGIPTMTYEIGDETDRELVRRLGRAAAEATMATLLGNDAPAN